MFHRKVHPESSTATKKQDKPMKKENKKIICYEGGQDNGGQMVPADEDIMIFPQRNLSKEKIRRYKSQSNPPQFTISASDSNGNREFWIKTDADCKYYTFPNPGIQSGISQLSQLYSFIFFVVIYSLPSIKVQFPISRLNSIQYLN